MDGFYDVALLLGEVKFLGNRSVLTRYSSKFADLLREGKSEIKIEKADPNTFGVFIQCFEPDFERPHRLELKDVKSLYDLANAYEVRFVAEYCEKLLTQHLYDATTRSTPLYILRNFGTKGSHIKHAIECLAYLAHLEEGPLSPEEFKQLELSEAVKDALSLHLYNRRSFLSHENEDRVKNEIDYLTDEGVWLTTKFEDCPQRIVLESGKKISWADVAWYRVALPGTRTTLRS